MKTELNVAVIGAGVVGLSTALSIKKVFPSFEVKIFADRFNEDTLSSGAGGLFRPEINVHPDSDRVRKWCSDSLSHFIGIINSTEASKAGMQLVSGYQLSSTNVHPENKLLRDLLPHYCVMEETEFESKMFPSKYKKGVHFTTVITDCRYYLPWLKSKFEEADGKVETKYISSLNEIPEKYNIIVNCTGLGAKKLMGDNQLMPVRGQTIRVKAPWVKQFYYGDDAYIVPGVDYIMLGGVKDYGSWDPNVSEYQRQFIWDKCTELLPSLKKTEILKEWVGLRPFRPSVRIDASVIPFKGHFRMVVNNYGHGGHGITLSWGTAQDVTRIIQKLTSENNFIISKL